MRDLTIARAARQAGVSVETIRFYERRGLIEQPRRPQGSGFRIYSPDQVRRIKFIRQAQQIGFTLHEIQELLSLRADPAADCSMVRGQAMAKLEEVRRKGEQLRQIASALEALIAVCPGRGGLQACTILDTLEPDDGRAPPIGAEGSPSAIPLSRRRQHNGQPAAQESNVKFVTLKIQGMHCDGCANTIKALVEREPGVKSVAVSFENGEARVLYDPAATGEDKLAILVERAGYRVTSRAR